MKRIISIFTITIILISLTEGVFSDSFVYGADDVPDGYTQITSTADQVKAFQYYCKSRNLAIEGSVLDAVTSVTTKAYQNAVQGAGLDMNAIQAELYKNSSNGQSFFYTVSGVSAMNRIFAEFLQNNNLAVGDEVNDQVLEQGKFYNGSFVYVFRYNYNLTVDSSIHNEVCTNLGTPYMSTDAFISLYDSSNHTASVTTSDGTFTFPIYKVGSGYYTGSSEAYAQYTNIGTRYTRPGFPAYFMTTKGELCFGAIFGAAGNTSVVNGYMNFMCRGIITGQNDNVQDTSVYITTNNETINNNEYNKATIINNNGNVVNIKNEYHYHYPIEEPTPTPTPNTIQWPTIDLPSFDIDFRIDGLTEKFPFSIPSDLLAFYTILNTDPQAPAIDRTIPLGFTDWRFQADFSQFDSYAEIIRKVEFIGFVIGLIYISIKLVKG